MKVGTICKVLKGYAATETKSWIHTGDIVRVIGNYPHHVLVERLDGDKTPGYRCRESFIKNDIRQHLMVLKG